MDTKIRNKRGENTLLSFLCDRHEEDKDGMRWDGMVILTAPTMCQPSIVRVPLKLLSKLSNEIVLQSSNFFNSVVMVSNESDDVASFDTWGGGTNVSVREKSAPLLLFDVRSV
jgi:hypothetical protein